MRLRAVACCLWYGLLPWWLYEDRCHYAGMTYWQHLALNARYALRWATGRQTPGDVRFEMENNRGCG